MSRAFALMLGGVTAALCLLAWLRWNLWTNGSDTGTFAQLILNAFSGFTNAPEGGTHFRYHWSPILAVLQPIVALTRSPLSIQIVQVLLVTASAIALVAIVRPYAGEKWAGRCGILLLIYPPLLALAFEEFHELAFYPVLALALFWAADRARWVWFAIFGLALALIREDVCLEVAVLGLAFAAIGLLRKNTAQRGLLLGEPRRPERLAIAGFSLAVICAGALAFYTLVVLPRVGPWPPAHFYSYPFAHGPLQTALAIFVHPVALMAATFTFGRLTYMLEAFAPLAFLPLRSRWTLLAVPGFAGILLSSEASAWRMGNHYAALWAPWLLLGASAGLAHIAQRYGEAIAARWWWSAVGISVAVLIAFNPMHPVHYLFSPYTHSNDVDSAITCVPNNAPVMLHDQWFAHIAVSHPRATILDEAAPKFRGYVVYSTTWPRVAVVKLLPHGETEAAHDNFRVVCHFGDVFVLARR